MEMKGRRGTPPRQGSLSPQLGNTIKKKHYLLLSRTHNSRNYGRDGRGLLSDF